ncbi:aldose 1-epimerase family protein [Angustibacter sp. McL0619]|uniref:aldose 1-epimerase family protein n=1 Tax=Angustibacter sp. McL0619 TaxID=3415676 RepID=UPI003CF5655A
MSSGTQDGNASPTSNPTADAPLPPTGEQVRISHAGHEAWTVAVAAGLRSLSLDGRPVVNGFAESERPSGGRGQTLVPWPNRIAGARYALDGAEQQLAVSEPSTGNAIHGLLRWVAWHVVAADTEQVTWECTLPPQPGWPTSLRARVSYALDDGGLTVTVRVRNVGDADCLYGTGSHPYLTAGTELVDDILLTVPAGTWYDTDALGIPTGAHSVDGTPYDLREPTRIGERVLDTAYGDLDRDADGRWRIRLTDPGTDRDVVLWADGAYNWAQVFSGDTLGPLQRRRGLAVEPMTCPPDAFNAPDPAAAGVVRLAPGDEHVATWGLSLN